MELLAACSNTCSDDDYSRYQELWKKHQNFTCLICQCEEPLEDAPSRPPTLKCKHDVSIYSDCMTRFLSNAIEKGGWQEIRCPDSSCDEVMSGADVQASASREAFLKYERRFNTKTQAEWERYEELVTMKSLSKLPNFRWCARVDCEYGQIPPGSESTMNARSSPI